MKKVQINRCGMCQFFDDGWCRMRSTSVQRTENGLEYIKEKTLACCYFRTKDKGILIRSKEAEAKLDKLIDDYTTPKLFDI